MNRSMQKSLQRQAALHRVASLVTLALWRWRQHWFLLLVTGVGMVAAVMVVCTIPLITAVMQTAGLRNVLSASPASSQLTLRATVGALSTPTLGITNRLARPPFQDHLEGYLKGPPRLEIQTPEFNVIPSESPTLSTPLQLYADSIQEAAPHVILIQGRLPRTIGEGIEVGITPATANALHVRVGSVITLESTFYIAPATGNTSPAPEQSYIQYIKLYVVGLFNVKPNDPFWHEKDFQPVFKGTRRYYTALASTQTLLAVFDRIAANYAADQVYFPAEEYAYLYWYYYLDPSRVSPDRLDEIIGQLAATQEAVAQANSSIEGATQSVVQQLDLNAPVLSRDIIPGSLERFRSRIAVLRIPVAILALQITCLILFFVYVMAELLVDRQADTIALLRSRGASDSQIFGSHVTQCMGLSLLALVTGPFLAYMAVNFIAQGLLPATDRDALNVLPNVPIVALLNVKWYALVTVGVTIVVMISALYRASHKHVLARRQQRARSPWRPLWQRLHLDLVASVIALTGYGIALYLADIARLLDVRTQALVSAPVALIAPLFLLLAAVLLFLRFSPLLLRIVSRFVVRGRGAVPMLAVAHLARSPRQAVRMIMLLALATAFAIFTPVFAASQAQRAVDISAYQSGADFSGSIPPSAKLLPLKGETKLYRNIAGVLSATVGYVGEEMSGATYAPFPLQVRAIDPDTFAQATTWPAQNSSQALPSLLEQLVVQRKAAIRQGVIPAIVDAYTWSRLRLHIGEAFFVQQNSTVNENVQYIAIAEVQHIPTLSNSFSGGDASTNLLSGNAIVDYQTLAATQKKYFGLYTPANYVWLRTSDDPAAVAHVRRVLQTSNMHLDNLNDRRALIDAMQTDPLYLNLIVILVLGAVAALLLALMGNLLTSWLSVRTRLTQFVVLRALGATPRQLAGVLTWEQGLVYLMALFIGVGFGVLLSITEVPTLVFSNAPAASALGGLSSDEFYSIQQVIPAQVVFPSSLGIAFAALVAICAAVVGMMAYIALRPSMRPILRFSEARPPVPSFREDAVIAHAIPAQRASRPLGRSVMARAEPAQRASHRTGWPFVTLALWRLRRSWLLLLMTSVGMIAAVMMVCAIPLLSAVTTTVGLRDTLNGSPEITLDTSTLGLSTRVVQSVQRQLDPYFQRHIGTYLQRPTSLSIQASGFTFISSAPPSRTYQLNLFATSMEQVGSRLTLLQGRLPQTASGVIETLLTPSTAASLQVAVGSMMQLHFEYASKPQGLYGRVIPLGTLNLRVVGLFQVTSVNDYLWHGNTFQPGSNGLPSLYTLLIPYGAFLAKLDHIAAASHTDAVFLPNSSELLWDYKLDTSRITYSQLADLTNQLTVLQADIYKNYGNIQNVSQVVNSSRYPYMLHTNVYDPVFGSFDILNILEEYLNRVDVFRIPAAILVLQIIGLILIFMSFMAGILVDHQADAIALLRSRGASGGQVAAFLITQGVGLGVIALVAGPPLATIAVSMISLRLLGPKEQDAINMITGHPVQVALDVGWYAVATALIIIIAMSLLLRRAASMNVLSLRQEAARSSRSTLWHHLSLDGGAAVIALTAYGISAYLTNLGKQLDLGTKTLFSAPLTIVASIFLIMGIMILFLRFFPFLLRLGAWFTVRSHGAAPMLAITQMARSPRYAVRKTLLLAFAIAFAIFTLVFSASQAQRIADISAYEAGADFSGHISHSTDHLSAQEETALYSTVPGVIEASVGYTAEGFAVGTAPAIPVEVRAVDANTFGKTAIWAAQNSSQPLTSLLAQLVAQRDQAIKARVVPTIIDAAATNELALEVGTTFTVNIDSLPYTTLKCIVIAEVQHIPTINSSADTGNTSPVGILMDYTTYAAAYRGAIEDNHLRANPILPFNHVWLRTSDDSRAVAYVRAALKTEDLRLDNLYDRRAFNNNLHDDPLILALMAFLTLGAITALVLALLGDLLASWLSVRTRLTQLAVLRALGATPRQVVTMLTWEQGIIYVTAFVLGGVFGAVLSMTVVPALIFTNTPAGGVLSNVSNSEFYILQQVVPAQIVVPSSLGIVLLALLVIFIVVLATMVRVALQSLMGQMLRLNED